MVAKEIRALPFACAAQVGNVFLVPGAWNCDFLNEIEGVFGGATHDDQHDAASGAHDVLAGGRYQRIRARDYRSAPEAQRRFNTRHYRTAGDPTGLQLDVPPSRRRAARQGVRGTVLFIIAVSKSQQDFQEFAHRFCAQKMGEKGRMILLYLNISRYR